MRGAHGDAAIAAVLDHAGRKTGRADAEQHQQETTDRVSLISAPLPPIALVMPAAPAAAAILFEDAATQAAGHAKTDQQ
jgi:hypothetical protein